MLLCVWTPTWQLYTLCTLLTVTH